MRKQRNAELSKKLGHVLMYTSEGMVGRMSVANVPVIKRTSGGRGIMQVRGEDSVHSASVVSALDEDDGTNAVEEAIDHGTQTEVEDDAKSGA